MGTALVFLAGLLTGGLAAFLAACWLVCGGPTDEELLAELWACQLGEAEE